jgi:hypothetical protein
VFPEYAVPGFDGVQAIDGRVADAQWARNSVVVAGIDGLAQSEYRHMCESLGIQTDLRDSPGEVPDGQWVNCCVVWTKDDKGQVLKWAQLKLARSWPEMNVAHSDMFEGNTVYLFRAYYRDNMYPCNFLVMVCYDWVAKRSGSTIPHQVLEQLNAARQQTKASVPIDWVLLIQHNEKPNCSSFLTSTYQFLTDTTTYPFVDRAKSVVLQANTAASERPARCGSRAFSSCTLSPEISMDCRAYRPTVCMQPQSLRGSDILSRCKDVVFREMGECVHRFSIRVPRFITPDATDRTYPITYAEVHAVTAETNDPRLSGKPIPAALKWVNDYLDSLDVMGMLRGCPLEAAGDQKCREVISDMRVLEGSVLCGRMNRAACSHSSKGKAGENERHENVDAWDQVEVDALEHVVSSLSLLGIAYRSVDVTDSQLHGTLVCDSVRVQVVAIRGETHAECAQHYDRHIAGMVVNDPVLVISRDHDNLALTRQEHTRFYEVEGLQSRWFLDYQRLASCGRNATGQEEFRGCIDEFIPRGRRII